LFGPFDLFGKYKLFGYRGSVRFVRPVRQVWQARFGSAGSATVAVFGWFGYRGRVRLGCPCSATVAVFGWFGYRGRVRLPWPCSAGSVAVARWPRLATLARRGAMLQTLQRSRHGKPHLHRSPKPAPLHGYRPDVRQGAWQALGAFYPRLGTCAHGRCYGVFRRGHWVTALFYTLHPRRYSIVAQPTRAVTGLQAPDRHNPHGYVADKAQTLC
jgi:hypothetical protein